MDSSENHAKHLVRQYMATRLAQRAPLPSMQEIRRQLGWDLLGHTPSPGGRYAEADAAASPEPR